jgi:hypothetical protein
MLEKDRLLCILTWSWSEAHVYGFLERVFSAATQICEHIFHPPVERHPLILEDPENIVSDIDYLILVMIYALLHAAWEKNILVIGIIKDISSAEMMKTVIPILQGTDMINPDKRLPSLNSDKLFLQTASVINAESMTAPWRTFEFDACFRTVVPPSVYTLNKIYPSQKEIGDGMRHETIVTVAFKNLISEERMFVKSYIQLWSSNNDPFVGSHVFSCRSP